MTVKRKASFFFRGMHRRNEIWRATREVFFVQSRVRLFSLLIYLFEKKGDKDLLENFFSSKNSTVWMRGRIQFEEKVQKPKNEM